MKNKALTSFIFLMFVGGLSAQNKDLVGSYKGRGGGIFLFPNKIFVLYGYMTIVPGTYEVLPDGIVLMKPKKEPIFSVYASQNKSLKPDEVRIRFGNGFEDNKSYLQFEDGKTFQILNDDANCFPSPRFTHIFSKREIGKKLTVIADFSDKTPLLTQGLKNTIQFLLGDNNDFLVATTNLTHYQIDGAAALVEKEGHTCLLYTNWGAPKDSEKIVRNLRKEIDKTSLEKLRGFLFAKEEPKDVDKEMEKMLNFDTLDDPKVMYMTEGSETISSGVSNEDFLEYNASKNVYKDPYNNIEYHKFEILELQQSTTDLKKLKIEPQTIFHYECEQPSKRRIYGTSN